MHALGGGPSSRLFQTIREERGLVYGIHCFNTAYADGGLFGIYAGTGETTIRIDVSYGDGVYRSRDGGRTWENVGLKESEHIGNILIDPLDTDVVYVAASPLANWNRHLSLLFPGALSATTSQTIARAESASQGVALMLVAPEFMRR